MVTDVAVGLGRRNDVGDLLSHLWLYDYSPMTPSGVLNNTFFQAMTECLKKGTKPLHKCIYIHFIPNNCKAPNIVSYCYYHNRMLLNIFFTISLEIHIKHEIY